MAKDDAAFRACLSVGNPVVGAVVEYHAVDEALDHASALVLRGLYHTVHGGRHIHIQSAGEELTACTEHQFGRDKRTLHCTKRTRLADKTLGRCRRVLTFGQTVDTVVEQAYVEIHVATDLVDKVVATNSEAVAIARHLPNIEFRMAGLNTRSDSTTTTVDGVKPVGVEIVWHTARAADTRDDYGLVGRYAHLCHGFLECEANSMVATARAELNGLVTFELICFHINIIILERPRKLIGAQVVDFSC